MLLFTCACSSKVDCVDRDEGGGARLATDFRVEGARIEFAPIDLKCHVISLQSLRSSRLHAQDLESQYDGRTVQGWRSRYCLGTQNAQRAVKTAFMCVPSPEPGAPPQRLHQFRSVNDRQRSWLPPTHRLPRREQSKALYPYRRAARAWRPVPRANRRQTQAPRSGSTPAGRCACLKDVSTRYALWLRFKKRKPIR